VSDRRETTMRASPADGADEGKPDMRSPGIRILMAVTTALVALAGVAPAAGADMMPARPRAPQADVAVR
jgi:hypothetical protein